MDVVSFVGVQLAQDNLDMMTFVFAFAAYFDSPKYHLNYFHDDHNQLVIDNLNHNEKVFLVLALKHSFVLLVPFFGLDIVPSYFVDHNQYHQQLIVIEMDWDHVAWLNVIAPSNCSQTLHVDHI